MRVADYDAYEPQRTLLPIGTDIWIVEGPVLRWGYGIPLKWPFPTRMTVIRLSDGTLWLHSPVRPDEPLIEAVEALGPVAHIVAPNMLHHVSLGAWAARFPQARLWASPGVRERSDVAFTDDLGDRPPPEWAGAIDQCIARGSRILQEVVFFHAASRTLVLTDLIENFEAERLHGCFNRWIYHAIGVMAPNGRAPADMRATFRGRHAELRPVVEWMIDCAPEKIVIAHGRWFRTNGADEVRRAFAWVEGIGSRDAAP